MVKKPTNEIVGLEWNTAWLLAANSNHPQLSTQHASTGFRKRGNGISKQQESQISDGI